MTLNASLTRYDMEWVLTLFGTAIGAGILFLPIQAGLGGIWPMIILTVIIFPLTYYSHRGITRLVASNETATDITGVVEQDLGRNAGFIVSISYTQRAMWTSPSAVMWYTESTDRKRHV